MQTIIGVDPGKKGAIVCINAERKMLWYLRMPVHGSTRPEYDRNAISSKIGEEWHRANFIDLPLSSGDVPVKIGDVCTLAIEKIHARGGFHANAFASLLHCIGIFEGIAAALEIPIRHYRPQAWQKETLGTKPRNADAAWTKSRANARALELWPELAETLKVKANQGIADAALIAETARRELVGVKSVGSL